VIALKDVGHAAARFTRKFGPRRLAAALLCCGGAVDGNPFDNIESAQQYLKLLADALQDAQRSLDRDVETAKIDRASPARHEEALRLVSYKLNQLNVHVSASRAVLNDLRMLRRLLLRERSATLPLTVAAARNREQRGSE
jgi:hypothetical protein